MRITRQPKHTLGSRNNAALSTAIHPRVCGNPMLWSFHARLGLRLARAVCALRVGNRLLRPWPAGGAFRAGGPGRLSFEGSPGRLRGAAELHPRNVWSSASAARGSPRVCGELPTAAGRCQWQSKLHVWQLKTARRPRGRRNSPRSTCATSPLASRSGPTAPTRPRTRLPDVILTRL